MHAPASAAAADAPQALLVAVHAGVVLFALSDHGWTPRGHAAAPGPILDMQAAGEVAVMTRTGVHVLDVARAQLGPSIVRDPLAAPLCMLLAAGRVYVAAQSDAGTRVADQHTFDAPCRAGHVYALASHDGTLLAAAATGIVCWDQRTGAQTQHMAATCGGAWMASPHMCAERGTQRTCTATAAMWWRQAG